MNRRSARRPADGLLALIAFAVLIAGFLDAARGDEGIGGVLRFLFGGNRAREAAAVQPPDEVIVEDVPAEFENQFTPHLKKLLNAELHFAHKVCDLDAEQFSKLEQTGRQTIAAIAKNYGKQQNEHQSSSWPDARQMLNDAFQKQIDDLLSPEVAERYREETAARRKARQEAAREMMVMLIDRKASLAPEQYDQVAAAVDEHWNPAWSRNMQVFLHDDYAPMPPDNVLRPLLTERQRGVWGSRTNYGQVSFGWEQDLGLMAPWGEIGELEVKAPVRPEEPAAELNGETP